MIYPFIDFYLIILFLMDGRLIKEWLTKFEEKKVVKTMLGVLCCFLASNMHG